MAWSIRSQACPMHGTLDQDLHSMTLPVSTFTARFGCVGKARHLKSHIECCASQLFGSPIFTSVPGVSSVLASESVRRARPPHFIWASAMST